MPPPARRGGAAARRPQPARPRQPAPRLAARRRPGRGRAALAPHLLTAALVSFDAATIATIHQFCQLVLRSLGVAGDTDASAILVEDLEQLTTEIVDDLYLARFGGEREAARGPGPRRWSWRGPSSVTPAPWWSPGPCSTDSPDSSAAMRVRFAADVLEEVERRKRRLGVLSYDDLLSQLADALEDTTAAARTRMQHRWKFVLIDEFQDTDPVQWQVFRRAFSDTTTMVLIGDPKQAIYAFRGGDIVTYLQAAESATTTQTLGVNWRSDRPLLDAVQAVLEGSHLGDERIVVHPVEAHVTESRLSGAGAPFRLRVVRRADLGKGPRSKPPVALWRDHVITDTAHDIKRLIDAAPTFDGRDLVPGDIAVLAARRNELDAIQHALADVGVPSVVNAGGSVFHTPAAGEWLDPPRGTRAAAPQRPGPSLRPHVLLRLHRRVARRRRRRPDRHPREPGPHPGRRVHPTRSRGSAGGDGRRGTHRARARPGRRRAHPHRPAPHRRVPPARQHRAADGPGRTPRLAARAGRRREARGRLRAHPPPRLRRRGRAAGHHPRQQGPAIPRRLPPDPVEPLHRTRSGDPALPRRRGTPLPRRRRAERLPPPGGGSLLVGGRGRVAATALRRPHPGPVAGRRLVRPRRAQRSRLPAPPDALRPPPADGAGPRHVGSRRRGPDAHDPPGLAVRGRPGRRACDVGPARPHAARPGPRPT